MRLDGNIEDFDAVMLKLQDATSAPIYFTDEPEEDNGWYDRSNHTITIRKTGSEKAMLKTAVHEVTHSILHRDMFEPRNRDQMAVETESTAFLVCDHFGLNTSGYSFGYVAEWAETILSKRNGEKRLLHPYQQRLRHRRVTIKGKRSREGPILFLDARVHTRFPINTPAGITNPLRAGPDRSRRHPDRTDGST